MNNLLMNNLLIFCAALISIVLGDISGESYHEAPPRLLHSYLHRKTTTTTTDEPTFITEFAVEETSVPRRFSREWCLNVGRDTLIRYINALRADEALFWTASSGGGSANFKRGIRYIRSQCYKLKESTDPYESAAIIFDEIRAEIHVEKIKYHECYPELATSTAPFEIREDFAATMKLVLMSPYRECEQPKPEAIHRYKHQQLPCYMETFWEGIVLFTEYSPVEISIATYTDLAFSVCEPWVVRTIPSFDGPATAPPPEHRIRKYGTMTPGVVFDEQLGGSNPN